MDCLKLTYQNTEKPFKGLHQNLKLVRGTKGHRSKTPQESFTFGSIMPGRKFSSDYRYGFNGMERDDEVKNVDGSSLDFGARIYDPRIGRFLSMDPKTLEFAWQSPYLFAANNPILMIDFGGLHGTLYITVLLDQNGKPAIDFTTMNQIRDDAQKQYAEMGIQVKVEVKYTNYALTKDQFESRSSYDKADHYMVIGTPEQIYELDLQSKSKETGWEYLGLDEQGQSALKTEAEEVTGRTANTQNFTLINGENLVNVPEGFSSEGVFGSYVVQHEKGHRNFQANSEKHGMTFKNGMHSWDNIMEGGGTATEADKRYTPLMVEDLKRDHNPTYGPPKPKTD